MRSKSGLRMIALLPLLITLLVLFGTRINRAAELSDNAVKTVLEHRLTMYGLLQGNQIQITVANGVISLNGEVTSLDQKEKIAKYAHEVDDTYAIQNNLTVRTANLTDQQIADSVRMELDHYVMWSIFDWVEPQVSSGVVTLTGWVVDSWHSDGYANQAKKAPGVKQVINKIQSLPVSFTDDHLRRQAALVIYDDGILKDYGYRDVPTIHIIVDMGVVTLLGTVNSKYDADRATSLVSYRTNAFDVIDRLQVVSQK
jgi:osmotically-inducible protein OsmY